MGNVGTAADNAAMESFFALLQKNVLNTRKWATRDELRCSGSSFVAQILNLRGVRPVQEALVVAGAEKPRLSRLYLHLRQRQQRP